LVPGISENGRELTTVHDTWLLVDMMKDNIPLDITQYDLVSTLTPQEIIFYKFIS
jgi:hypothetical protein